MNNCLDIKRQKNSIKNVIRVIKEDRLDDVCLKLLFKFLSNDYFFKIAIKEIIRQMTRNIIIVIYKQYFDDICDKEKPKHEGLLLINSSKSSR